MSGLQRILILALGFSLLTACTSANDTPPVAVQVGTTPSVVAASPLPTSTIKPSATAEATKTAEPTATATPISTRTPRATRTPAPTRTATQAPSPSATEAPTITPTLEPSATSIPVPTATVPPVPTATIEPTPVVENPLGMIANMAEIPELDASYPNTDPALIEDAVRETFVERGYAITVDERSNGALILQFEREASIYAVRVTPFPDGTGAGIEIRTTSAATAFAEVTESEMVPASSFGFSLGDCVMPNESQTPAIVPCDTPHYLEVVGVFNHPAGANAPFPSNDEWYDVLTYDCETAFAEYTGAYPLGAHDYWYTGFAPTPTSWTTGDRQVVCLLFHVENELLTHSTRDEFR
jgi:hypothetical protein